MDTYIWLSKPHTRFGGVGEDSETIETNQEFEPTEHELAAFKDKMRRADKRVAEEHAVVTSVPDPSIPDIPQKGLLHRQELEEDGTLPEPRRRGRRPRVAPGEEGESEAPRIAHPDDEANAPAPTQQPLMGVEHDDKSHSE